MAHKEHLEDVLNQIQDLIRMAQEKGVDTLEGAVPPELEARVERLEKEIARFRALNEEILVQKNLPVAHLKELQENLQMLHPHDRRLIEYAGQLSTRIREAKNNHEAVIQETLETHEIAPRRPKERPRHRRFKRVGGQKNWKPL